MMAFLECVVPLHNLYTQSSHTHTLSRSFSLDLYIYIAVLSCLWWAVALQSPRHSSLPNSFFWFSTSQGHPGALVMGRY